MISVPGKYLYVSIVDNLKIAYPLEEARFAYLFNHTPLPVMDWETKKKGALRMEFISCEHTPIREPMSWPNMCVSCLSVPTMTYKVRGGLGNAVEERYD